MNSVYSWEGLMIRGRRSPLCTGWELLLTANGSGRRVQAETARKMGQKEKPTLVSGAALVDRDGPPCGQTSGPGISRQTSTPDFQENERSRVNAQPLLPDSYSQMHCCSGSGAGPLAAEPSALRLRTVRGAECGTERAQTKNGPRNGACSD